MKLEQMKGMKFSSFDSIGIPIKEGSEGFFTVQYNSIFKISIVFTLLILSLYIIRGGRYQITPRR